MPVQVRGDPPGGDLGPREDEDLAEIVGAHEVLQELELALPVHRVEDLANGRDGGVAGRHLHGQRVAEELPGEAPDLVGEGGREEERLAPRREEREDPPDVRDEPHVEHPVPLVEDEDLDLAQVRGALPDEVEEAPGRRHQELHAAPQLLDLGIERDAAEDDSRAEGDVAPVGRGHRCHLHGQLSRGRQDERPHRVAGRRERGVRVVLEALEDGEDEGRGLAGPGLGRAHEVATLEDERDRLDLDGRWGGKALVGHRAQEFGRQAERIEGHGFAA